MQDGLFSDTPATDLGCSKSQDKLLEILSYLDEVEKTSDVRDGEAVATAYVQAWGGERSTSAAAQARNSSSCPLPAPISVRERLESSQENLTCARSMCATETKQKYVWDELNDIEAEMGEWDEASAAPSEISRLSYSTDLQSMYDQIRSKAGTMQQELQERAKDVDELQSALMRKRASYEKARKSVEQVWKTRLKKLKKEHGKAMEDHTALADQLTGDVAGMAKKVKDLQKQVEQLRAHRSLDLKKVRQQGAAELQRAKEAWVAGERARLQKLAAGKAEEIKNQTIKSLEPELHKLISGNRQEIRQRKADGQKRMADLKAELERETELRLADAQKDLDRQTEEAIAAFRTEQENRLADLSRQHDRELKEAKANAKAELETERAKFEAERHRLLQAHTDDIEATSKTLQEKVKLTMDAHERELVALSMAQAREVEETKRRLMLENEQWRPSVMARLQSEFHAQKEMALSTLRRQHAQELERVLKRLKEEQIEEHAALEAKREAELDVLREEQQQELSVLEQKRDAARERLTKVIKAVEEDEATATRLQAEADDLEEHVKGAEKLLWDARRDVDAGKLDAQIMSSRKEEEAKDSLREMEAQIEQARLQADASAVRAAEAKAGLEKDIGDYQYERNTDLLAVQEKIETILKRKNDLVTGLRAQLTSLQTLIKSKEADLERYRKLTYV